MAIKILTPTSGVYVAEYYPNTNFSDTTQLFAGRFDGPGDIYRSLLQFDLGCLCSNITVNSANLLLYVNRKDIPDSTLTPQPLNVLENKEDYDPNTVTWNNQPSTGILAGSYNITDADLNNTISINITNLVQEWVSGTVPNTSLILEGVENQDALIGFINVFDGGADFWPAIQIDYTNGINTQYPLEQFDFQSGDEFSEPIPYEAIDTISYEVEVTGTGQVVCTIQISNDGGTTWVDDLETETNVAAGDKDILTSVAVGELARLKLESSGNNTADVFAITRDS